MKVKITKGDGGKNLDKMLLDKGFSKKASIGWFPKNKYADNTPVAQVAAWNEFGRYARPFMRPTISENSQKWSGLSSILSKRVLKGGMNQTSALEQLSLVIESDFRKAIVNLKEPALAESTILSRMSKRKSKARTPTIEKPLVDTGIMLNTLTKVIK